MTTSIISSQDYVDFFYLSIINGQIDDVNLFLDRVDLQHISYDKSYIMLSKSLNICADYNRQHIFHRLIQYWDLTAGDDNESHNVTLWAIISGYRFSDRIVYYLFTQMLQRWNFVSYILELMERPQDEKADLAMKRITSYFLFDLDSQVESGPRLLDDNLYFLYQRARDLQAYIVVKWLFRYLVKNSAYAAVPYWIRDYRLSDKPNNENHYIQTTSDIYISNQKSYTGCISRDEAGQVLCVDDNILLDDTDVMPVEADIRVEIFSPQKAAAILTSDISIEKDSHYWQNFETVLTTYEQATHEEKKEMLRHYYRLRLAYIQAEDIGIFRLLGPTNAGFTLNHADWQENSCTKYGGCRMLLCNCSSQDLPEGETESDWFRGYCLECGEKIRTRAHAVRRPIVHGNWAGCYCTWACVRRTVVGDIYSLALIEVFSYKIDIYGIQDRLDEN